MVHLTESYLFTNSAESFFVHRASVVLGRNTAVFVEFYSVVV